MYVWESDNYFLKCTSLGTKKNKVNKYNNKLCLESRV